MAIIELIDRDKAAKKVDLKEKKVDKTNKDKTVPEGTKKEVKPKK